MRKLSLFLLSMILCTPFSYASDTAGKFVPNAAEVGKGKLSIVLLDVFEATLYAPNGRWEADAPHALSIRYFQNIDGDDIAVRSVDEIRNQGFSDDAKLAEWKRQMLTIFPDVKDGTELTAVFTKEQATDFYANGQAIGSIKDAQFSRHFSDIWLGKKTSQPALRRKLLGL